MKLWLDDVRPPHENGAIGFEWAKDTDQAIALLRSGDVTFASLDHDLSVNATLGNWKNEITGYDVLCWMEENDVWPIDGVVVHSMNPVGKERMQVVIDEHYKR